MGDHRADIKLKMEIHGKTYKHEMWINYFPNEDGIDQRIINCFRDWCDRVFARYQAQIDDDLSTRKSK